MKKLLYGALVACNIINATGAIDDQKAYTSLAQDVAVRPWKKDRKKIYKSYKKQSQRSKRMRRKRMKSQRFVKAKTVSSNPMCITHAYRDLANHIDAMNLQHKVTMTNEQRNSLLKQKEEALFAAAGSFENDACVRGSDVAQLKREIEMYCRMSTSSRRAALLSTPKKWWLFSQLSPLQSSTDNMNKEKSRAAINAELAVFAQTYFDNASAQELLQQAQEAVVNPGLEQSSLPGNQGDVGIRQASIRNIIDAAKQFMMRSHQNKPREQEQLPPSTQRIRKAAA